MKKVFTKNLCVYMVVGMIIAIVAVFILQTFMTQISNSRSSEDKLISVEQKLADNQTKIDSLKESLGENCLAKTKAFADIIEISPSIINDSTKMEQLKEDLMVNELHVVDGNGIITHSSIAAYVGFDMGSGEQSAEFLEIIDDPSKVIVQEPQENVAEGILMQYVGVARKDAPGFVQVGIRPEILEEMLSGNQIDKVLSDIEFGDTGYIYAVDIETGQIVAHKNEELIGKSAKEEGISSEAGKGKVKSDGVTGYYVAKEYDGKIIGTFMPAKEYYKNRMSQTLVVSISLFIIFVILLLMINRMVDRNIVKGINNISDALKIIAEGNYSVEVTERGNDEFELLSSCINRMTESIRNNLDENKMLLDRQKMDMENNTTLIGNVKNVCAQLEHISQETLDNAHAISIGTEEQETAVNALKDIMDSLSDGLNASADATVKVSAITSDTVITMTNGKEHMGQLEESIQQISDTSVEIEKIIGEINSIASQTNMLSLNASIEAARAGEMGKGFAVVATQVGELAARSAQAAKETDELIMSAINAIEDGRKIMGRTVEAFDTMVEEIEKASSSVKEITDMVSQNVTVVAQAMEGIGSISDVVERNVVISQNSEKVSVTMAEEAGSLMKMVEQ